MLFYICTIRYILPQIFFLYYYYYYYYYSPRELKKVLSISIIYEHCANATGLWLMLFIIAFIDQLFILSLPGFLFRELVNILLQPIVKRSNEVEFKKNKAC